MKFAVWVRDYFYPMRRGAEAGGVRPTYECGPLSIGDFPEALDHINRMKAAFAPIGWDRDYWMTMVDDHCLLEAP